MTVVTAPATTTPYASNRTFSSNTPTDATTNRGTPTITAGYESAAQTVTATASSGNARSIGVAWWTAIWQAYAASAAVMIQLNRFTNRP